jgi:hypothetical protein
MDVIWKELSEHNLAFNRLRLYCYEDPASSALYVIESNHLHGITYESNFRNDAAYLMDFILPDAEALQAVKIDWTYMSRLEPGERERLLLSIAHSSNVQELAIAGASTDDSKVPLSALSNFLEYAFNLRHLSVEVSSITCESKSEFVRFCDMLQGSTELETLHITSLSFTDEMATHELNDLFMALKHLPKLRSIRLSQVHTSQSNGSNNNASATSSSSDESTVCTNSFEPSSLNCVQSLSLLENLSLVNMGLNDDHCRVLENALARHSAIRSLVLLDNVTITDEGNASLLRLLERNRSIYNTIYGIDVDSSHRTDQLKLLHMNRCGRQAMNFCKGANALDFVNYISKINEIVPEDFELDAIFSALTENPELLRSYDGDIITPSHSCALQRVLSSEDKEDIAPFTPRWEAYLKKNASTCETAATLPTSFGGDDSMLSAIRSCSEYDFSISRHLSLSMIESELQEREVVLYERRKRLEAAEQDLREKEDRLHRMEKKIARNMRRHYGSHLGSVTVEKQEESSYKSYCLPGFLSMDLLSIFSSQEDEETN